MKFDFQFLNWIWDAIKRIYSGDRQDPQASQFSNYVGRKKVLIDLATKANVLKPVEELIQFWDKKYPTSNPRYWGVFLAKTHSRNKRFYLFDTEIGVLLEYYMAHGKGSDTAFTGICQTFSNNPGVQLKEECERLKSHAELMEHKASRLNSIARDKDAEIGRLREALLWVRDYVHNYCIFKWPLKNNNGDSPETAIKKKINDALGISTSNETNPGNDSAFNESECIACGEGLNIQCADCDESGGKNEN